MRNKLKEMEESVKMARSDKGMDTTFDKKLAGVLESMPHRHSM